MLSFHARGFVLVGQKNNNKLAFNPTTDGTKQKKTKIKIIIIKIHQGRNGINCQQLN